MSYTMYTPLKVWIDPASVPDVVAHIQKYLIDNPISTPSEIEAIINDYLTAHPSLIGVQSVNGETGNVVLSASDIKTENDVTIESALSSLSSQISNIAASVATNTNNITGLTGRMSTAETDISNLKSNLDYVTPEMYGAVGDGVTDDTNAIQTALNTGKDVVFSRGKNYKISDSLYVPFKTNVDGQGCTIWATSALSNKYMFRINADAELEWVKTYPYDDQIFANFEFKTIDEIYNINGIYNAGSGTISNIISVGINVLVKCENKYIDHMLVKNCTALDHGTEDYAFHSGYLGDTRQFDGLKCIALNENPLYHKGLFVGQAHRNVIIKNYIQGDLEINSNAYLENIMMSYQGTVYINSSNVIINNFYAVFTDYPRIVIRSSNLKNSFVSLNSAEFVRLRDSLYIPGTPIPTSGNACISIDDNSSIELNNSFITYQAIINDDRKSYGRVTFDNEAFDNLNKMINSNFASLDLRQASYKKQSKTNAFALSAYNMSTFSFWQIDSGTYYYKALSIMCLQRGIFNLGTSEASAVATKNGNAIGLIAQNGEGATLRILRGNASGQYTHYADVAVPGKNVFIHDDGNYILGVAWKEIDFTIPSTAYCAEAEYDYISDILVSKRTTKYGTAKENDIIFNTASVASAYLSIYTGSAWHDVTGS